MENMLKVAIIGCGKIADAHASWIQRIGESEIVAVCDREPLMARQLFDRFPIKSHFTEASEMLDQARPDAVHITTSPESHYDLARLCLESGASVYVEKPFTVNVGQAEVLLNLAEEKGLKLTVGHNEQFTPAARRLRALVTGGYLGEIPVHMECHHCYSLDDPNYARALLGDKQHWVRRLPGKLLHNIISHGIARIAEFMSSDCPQVIAYGFVSPLLKSIHETDIIDELRVILSEGECTTAYFSFSTQMRPAIHEFRIFGSKNGLILDQDHDIVLKLRGAKYKSYADKFVPSIDFAKQHLSNLLTNSRLFLTNQFHMDAGMGHLIKSFHRSITEKSPVPIPYREILLTARIMDNIFEQLQAGGAHNLSPSQAQHVPS
jgi:predicted dehydrogenase